MEYFKIELEGNHFVESYLVYVIEVSTGEGRKYFYIGQTGDRNHFIARPAFRRLGAHLSDQGYSTENQLYRHIASKILNNPIAKSKAFDTETKRKVTAFLKTAKICMHAFPIKPFDRSHEAEHKANRQFVESIESEVITQLSKHFGSTAILNSRTSTKGQKLSTDALEITKVIMNTVCT